MDMFNVDGRTIITTDTSYVQKLFDFWMEHSEDVCECCKYNYNLKCEGKACNLYYELTDEEIAKKGLAATPHLAFKFYSTDAKWNCFNTDDSEFCRKIKGTVCDKCLESGFKNFEPNGEVR